MIRAQAALFILVLSATTGISALRGQESVDPRGPYPDFGAGNAKAPRTGDLEVTLDPGDLRGGSRQVQDSRRPRVRVYDGSGRLLREAILQSTTPGAVTVDLPQGRYLVEVVAPSTARKPFWVTVRENRATIVDPSLPAESEDRRPPAEP